MYFDILIIAYNNSSAIKDTVSRLISDDISLGYNNVIIYDNCSYSSCASKIESICTELDLIYYRSNVNRGWGGAINHFLMNQNQIYQSTNSYILIMAHDAYFLRLNLNSVESIFTNDNKALFVSPSYNVPIKNHYNIYKSYYSRQDSDFGRVLIGQQTAFFANKNVLKSLLYDEEFWIYGCEYEIQLRASDIGLHSYQLEDSVIINCHTDTPTSSSNIIYTLNSLYLSHKRHGILGLYIRSLVVFFTLFKSLFVDQNKAGELLMVLLFCNLNPGKGFSTYKSNPKFFYRFNIPSLVNFLSFPS